MKKVYLSLTLSAKPAPCYHTSSVETKNKALSTGSS